MIIKSIELENIRSYKQQIIYLKEGINFLSGDIGSGKSSILQAIEFSLFGFKRGDLEGYQLIRKGELNGSVKLCIIDKNNKEIEIYRKLKKSKTNENITQDSGYIKIDDNIIELAPTEINNMVFKLLNFPIEFLSKDKNLIYRYTIYTPQEQLKEILFAEEEKRLEIIRKIFNIDKYKQLKNAISIYSNKIRENKNIFKTKLEEKPEIIKKNININIELNQKNKQLKEYKIKNLEFEQKLKKYKQLEIKTLNQQDEINLRYNIETNELAKIKEIEKNQIKIKQELILINNQKKKINIDKLNSENKKIKFEIEEIEQKLKNIKNKKKEFENIKEQNIEEKIKQTQIVFNKIITKQEIYKSKQKEINLDLLNKSKSKIIKNKEIIKLNLNKIKLKNEINTEIKQIEKQLFDLNLKSKSLNDYNENNENKIKDINNIDICPTCIQKVNQTHKFEIEKKLNKEIEKNKIIINKINLELTEIEKKLKLKKQFQDEIENLEKQNIKLEQENKNLNQKIQEITEKQIIINKLKQELDSLNFQKIENDLKILNSKQENINKLKLKKQELLVDELKINEDKNNKLIIISKNEKLIEKYINIENEIIKLEKELKAKSKQLINKEKKLITIKNIQEKQIKIKENLLKLKQIIEKIQEKQKQISNLISSLNTQINDRKLEIEQLNKKNEQLKEIENKLNKLLNLEYLLTNKLVSISNNIEIKVFTKYYIEFNEQFEKLFHQLIEDNDIEVRLNTEFKPIIEQNGYDTNINNLSGGEKSSLAIAYRLGLKKIIENNLTSKQKLSLLILDEPTDGFSNEQIDRLGLILKNINLKQIILVSHDEKIESISDHILNVEKINHSSKIMEIN